MTTQDITNDINRNSFVINQTESDLHKVRAINECFQELYNDINENDINENDINNNENRALSNINDFQQFSRMLKPKLKRNVALNVNINKFVDKHFTNYQTKQVAKDELFELVTTEIVGTLRGIRAESPMCSIL